MSSNILTINKKKIRNTTLMECFTGWDAYNEGKTSKQCP